MSNDPHTLRLFKRSEERPSLTIVCCVDKRYLKQAAVTLPLWLEAAGEIANYPFIVFYCDDGANSIPYEDVKRVFSVLPEVRYVAWPKPEWAYAGAYSSQREMMLTSFCHAHYWVDTEYFLKIDVDAFPVRRTSIDEWFSPEFFHEYRFSHPRVERPALVASAWGYTKPRDQMTELDNWADKNDVPGVRMNLVEGTSRVVHPRIASWFCYVNTKFCQEAAHFVPPGRIPVPSHDGFHWYMAARMGWPIYRTKFKRTGWTNCPRFKKLLTKVGGIRKQLRETA